MKTKATDLPINRDRKLTASQALDRMVEMMNLWWEGRNMADIGRAFGVSRQRVAAILMRVGCTRALWRMADHERPDSQRRGWRHGADRARAALLHPLAHRLTIRQRAALAWQAQGLALPDIARRMRATSQNVRGLQVAAHWRLERLARTGGDHYGEPTTDVTDLDWSDVVETALLRGSRYGRAKRRRARIGLTSGQNVQRLTTSAEMGCEHESGEKRRSDRNNASMTEALAK